MPRALPLALVVALSFSGPGPGTAPARAGDDERRFDPSAAEATISLLALSPEPGERVTRDTVVTARLGYSVGQFRPGQFVLVPQFAHREPRRTSPGGVPPSAALALDKPAGDLTLRIPLSHPWYAPDVAHPLVIWFQIHQKVGSGMGVAVASTQALRYETDKPLTLPEDDQLWSMGVAPPDPEKTVTPPSKVKHVAPKYPRAAARAGLTGDVVAKMTIDAEGKVTDIEVLEGVPPLTDAALKAMKKWKYTPSKRDGKPVPTIITHTINFQGPTPDGKDLLDSLESRNEHLREAAAKNLGASAHSMSPRGREKAIKALEELLESEENGDVRTAALLSRRALGK